VKEVSPEDRAWEIVRRAFEERDPHPRRTSTRNRLVGAAVVAAVAVGAAVVSPAGHAVFERVRQAVGVEHAAPALAALPARGRLLVLAPGHGGTWIVDADGAKRRIGFWNDASWSPHGLYVVAGRHDRLVTLDPKGRVAWTLARRGVKWPVWEGTRTDTRIAYFAGGRLRVVAGDGTDDHVLDPHPLEVSGAWRPGGSHVLAYAAGGDAILRRVDSGQIVWRRRLGFVPTQLDWSTGGALLAVASPHRVVVLDAGGHPVRTVSSLGGTIRSVAFRPGTGQLAVTVRRGTRSEVRLVDISHPGRSRLLFAGPGLFGDTVWSPNGIWLLIDWPTANQWLFVSAAGSPRVRAVANIDEQFPRPDRVGAPLELAGRWCCPPSG
jgi:hypothetical protein